MSIIEHAAAELERADFANEDAQAIIETMERFLDQFDSGGAVSCTLPVLVRLISGQPLSPLTGADDEWNQPLPNEPMLQNKRCSSVFKITGEVGNLNPLPVRIYDIYNPGWDGTFPYDPATRMLEMPIIEV